MLEDFLAEDDSAAFLDEIEAEEDDVEPVVRTSSRRFLGMTPAQRAIIALMLLMWVCIVGSFCLIITEAVTLPFLN